MRVELIAVPYDSARRGERMGAGPEYLLQAGLERRLKRAGHAVRVHRLGPPANRWRAEIGTAFDLARAVAASVEEARRGGGFPLVLSGNCGPAALGCVSGLRSRPSVFWFDAHGDFNTPETTIGGFLDGMALATLTGRCWTQLAGAIPGFRPVPEESVTLIGVRDLDSLEAAALERSGIRRVGSTTLRPDLPAALARADPTAPAYLHLDLDVLDPAEGPINPYSAAGGLTRDDVAWAIETIIQAVPIGAAAVTAYDPDSDPAGTGGAAALSLVLTLVAAAAGRRTAG